MITAQRRALEVMSRGKHRYIEFRVSGTLAVFGVVACSKTTPNGRPALSLAPGTMSLVGTVDERFQSYNIEMLEVTGGNFWKPYGNPVSLISDCASRMRRGSEWGDGLFQAFLIEPGHRGISMSDLTAIRAIEEELARDRKRLAELEKHETELLENIPDKGFHTATDRVNLRSEMKVLEDSIRKKEKRLIAARK
jgi:hypothetical protein